MAKELLGTLLILLATNASARRLDFLAKAEVAMPSQFPFFAQLRLGLSETSARDCCGTLIDRRWVLTAGHCFDGVPRDHIYKGWFTVLMGTNDWTNGKTNVIADFKVHPDYVGESAEEAKNDVAVAKLKRRYRLTNMVGVVRLAPPARTTKICKLGMVIGTGPTTPTSNKQNGYVLYAEVKSWTSEELIKLDSDLASQIDDNVFFTITYWLKGRELRSSSGGPFLCYRWSAGGDMIPVQYGINSISVELKEEGMEISVMEPVKKHLLFIMDHVPRAQIYGVTDWWPERATQAPDTPWKWSSKSLCVTVRVNSSTFFVLILLFIND